MQDRLDSLSYGNRVNLVQQTSRRKRGFQVIVKRLTWSTKATVFAIARRNAASPCAHPIVAEA
jgi:hypothetical protein